MTRAEDSAGVIHSYAKMTFDNIPIFIAVVGHPWGLRHLNRYARGQNDWLKICYGPCREKKITLLSSDSLTRIK